MSTKKLKNESTLQHLHRKPDNYIGPNNTTTATVFVASESGKVSYKEIDDWNEALIHPFKELIDNAADNARRDAEKPQTFIDIKVTDKSIEVTNDGAHIPIVKETIEFQNEISKKTESHTLWRTQGLFNYFRTGTNADNNEDDAYTGTNGIGAKACIGIAKYAKIHHSDPATKQQLAIEYKNRMSEIGEPVITPYKKAAVFTSFYYEPDFKWYGLKKLSENHIGIMHAMAMCLAFSTGLKVTFNGNVLKVANIKALGEMFFGPRNSLELTNDAGDQVLVMEQTLEEMEEYGMRSLSFVNNSFTRAGGIHVKNNAAAVGKALATTFGAPLKPADAQKFLIFVVNYTIKGSREYTGQTKAGLESVKAGLKVVKVDKKDINKCKKWDLWAVIAAFLAGKTNAAVNKGISKKEYVGGLGKDGIDANFAGGKKAQECTMFICEGQSAKTLIDSGMRHLGGSDFIGILALQGKISNVMKITAEQQGEKKFLCLMRKMLGLKMGCKYETAAERKSLRYGRVILVADQDFDGWHVESLVTLALFKAHPGLLHNGFVQFLETPVIRTTVGKQVHRFFLREDFDEWLKEQSEAHRAQAVKNCDWIKGLGGNDEEMGDVDFIFNEQFFLGQFTFAKKEDEDLMDIFFGGAKYTQQKKAYMMSTFYNDEWIHLPKKGTMSFSEFIEHKMTPAVNEQIHRAIPYVYDGLKESFKDILWTAFKRLKGVGKTDSFSLDVSKYSSYSHGGQNIGPTVNKLAGNIVGLNNILIFKGIGGFGNRFAATDDGNGHGAAASRYTRISLQPIVRTVFRPEDDPILEYIEKEGAITSPEYYLPTIPWFAVNGCPSSPGNAYSTIFPSYNPEDLVKWVQHWIGENFADAPKIDEVELVPWFRGFRGTVEKYPNGWLAKGILKQDDAQTWTVDEIAAGCWGVNLKLKLEELADAKKIEKPRIMNENRNTIRAIIKTRTDFDVELALKAVLEHKYPMTNVTLIHEKAPITLNNVEEHLDVYARRRYKGYQDRRKYQMKELERQIKMKADKIKFIQLVIDEKINFKKIKNKDELVKVLISFGFTPDVSVTKQDEDEDDPDADIEEEETKGKTGFEHITSMTFLSCTKKGIDALEKDKAKIEERYNYYRDSKPWKLWLDDLDEFVAEYPKYLAANPVYEVVKGAKKK